MGMRKITAVLLFILLGLEVNAQTDSLAFAQAAEQVRKQYAPDKRAIYFNMRFKADSIWLESSDRIALQEFDKIKPNVSNVKLQSVLIPNQSLNGLEYGVANLSVSNNRANPQHAAELITQMLLGTPIRILKKQGGYYLVKTPDQYLSWVEGAAIKAMDKTQFENWQKADKIVFIADYGHSFSNADLKSTRVSDLVSGNILQLLGTEKNFY
ncbi:MAG: SH3 domain-containing protein, partial [Flavobacterium sp.]